MQNFCSVAVGMVLWAALVPSVHAADPVWEYTVQVSATAQASPPRIVLTWPQDTVRLPNRYIVYRKEPGAAAWGTGTTLAGDATSFADSGVAIGRIYEYQIQKESSGFTGYGYISAGVQAPLAENRGKVVLVVDETHASSLVSELSRLQQDLVGDGWTVLRHDVARTDSASSIKQLIRAEYLADPPNVKAVFLFGRVPVPYSGLQNPDGHSDHYGAWPADGFYGEMDGSWTDSEANHRQTQNTDPNDRTRLTNLPGDGKFDQSLFPSEVELQVGRVDLSSMPGRTHWGGPATFPDERSLLRQYLNKNHNFRHKRLNPRRRAVVGDYFGSFGGEAFAASGYRGFAPLFGAANITNLNLIHNDAKGVWIPHLAAHDYLWAYACGAGSYLTIGGLGNTGQYHDCSTIELVNHDVRAVFAMFFGSWHGDWDHEDSILRSILATPTHGLAAMWSGRPHWYIHPMALGETIGHAARLTQNNRGLYQNQLNRSAGSVTIALLGDPTLRLHPVAPPPSFQGTVSPSSIALSWTASPEPVLGYHVYRSDHPAGPFARLTPELVSSLGFVDQHPGLGNKTYMLRAVKLETSASGSYSNASQGVFWTAEAMTPPPQDDSSQNLVVWFDDALPAGAGPSASGGDSWDWVKIPAPYSGALAHRSSLSPGQHEHSFNWAGAPLEVGQGETLFTCVYLDPANPPRQLMLSWKADTWEHRAYWGSNLIPYGTDGTPSRKHMGPLPPAGQWVRLDVPADLVALEDQTITGMGFSLYDGQATWDYTGKLRTSTPPPTLPTVTVHATDPQAHETGREPGAFTISRTLDTGSPLTIYYSLGGTAVAGEDFEPPATSVTIPAGAIAAVVIVRPIDDGLVEGSEAVTLQITPHPAYTIGTAQQAVLAITDNDTPSPPTSPPPEVSAADYTALALPKDGSSTLHVLSPTMLELRRITAKEPDPAPVESWDFVDANGVFHSPPLGEFLVTVDGQPVQVQAVGFKRRPLYAPLAVRDLRIENGLYLRLASPIQEGQTVEVRNPSDALWPGQMPFHCVAHPLRFSPAIHVNQEGYVPSLPKKAMIGFYLGSLGEMDIPAAGGFSLVDANTGSVVHQGTLVPRRDTGYSYEPKPYQKVFEADFTAFQTPGQYRLVVPGLGASLPFRVDEGVAMAFLRTYALGLYHQRCGIENCLPFTRHTHGVCHSAAVEVPSPQSSFSYTWGVIAAESNASNNPRHTAPQLKDEASQLYPFVNRGPLDIRRGHHDAGDYSKYTINSANLVHYLLFTVDNIPGAGALDNLGLPESGDGIGDLLQEAKWEADFIANLQDADGGFYFLVYPRNRRYENNVLPDAGDTQIVWPKNTAATAAAVAALAQCASSPRFKLHFPEASALYLQKARLGWQFLTNAIARFGKDGSYQKVTFYGDEFMHDDELAWAAAEMFAATGQAAYHQKLKEWFPNPNDPATRRWGWWRLSSGYGNVIRSYGFAARSGRLTAGQLEAGYLASCQAELNGAGGDALAWSQQNAYGTSFPYETKQVRRAGWYFSSDHAADMAVAHQLEARPDYVEALLANMNYEGGCNPVNVTYITGLGWKRQREIVHQYAQNDRRVLPPTGIPIGNIQESFYFMNTYQGELNRLCFPGDWSSAAPYPFYDRWGDSYNVMTEFIHLNQARSVLMLALLNSFTSAASQPWSPPAVQIQTPGHVVPVDQPTTLTLQAPGLDLSLARVVWEGRDQEPAFGATFSFVPKNNGAQWVEVEAQWPDGRRVFATNSFYANSPVVSWVDDALPAGAVPGANDDSWTWVSTPAPHSGTLAHQSTLKEGLHQHYFEHAVATLDVSAGDILFAYVYLDPANVPGEIMLQWNDGSWEHRAYWGANLIDYGNHDTAGRRYMGPLPPAGQWVRLEVPASAVGLEGRTLKGMAFSLHGGRATWDSAGKSSPTAHSPAILSQVSLAGSNQIRVSWTSIVGKTYRVAFKSDMDQTSWLDLSPNITATSATSAYTDTAAGTLQQRFYRVYAVD